MLHAIAAVLIVVSALASTAVAADGVIEINQAIALAGRVTGDLASDPAGFPVRITKSGSYRLTSNLDLAAALDPTNTNAIMIAANDVNLDLGGFAIEWTNQCSGGNTVPVVCTTQNFNGLAAVIFEAPLGIRVRVHNGVIRGMPGSAVMLGDDAVIEDLRIAHSTSGISGGNASRVTGNTIRGCSAVGIQVENSSLVEANVVDRCIWGIVVGGYNRVHGNAVNANSGDGISSGGLGNLLTGNQISLNGGCAIGLSNHLGSGRGGNTGSGNNARTLCIGEVAKGVLVACDFVNGTRNCL